MKIKVTICDDHPMVVNGLKLMLSQSDQVEVISAYTHGSDLIAGLQEQLPDVLLMDIQMPGMSGNDLVRIISKKHPLLGIIAVTSLNSSVQLNDMLNNGCQGYLLKNTELPALVLAIKKVHAGQQFIDSNLGKETLAGLYNPNRINPDQLPALTKRERDVLKLIISGCSNLQIAEQLFLNIRTIETHRYNLMQKLKVNNVIELVRVAVRNNVV